MNDDKLTVITVLCNPTDMCGLRRMRRNTALASPTAPTAPAGNYSTGA